MKKAGYNVTVKIFEDEDAFISRCRQLSVRSADDMKKEQGILDTIKAVSL